MKIFIAVLVTLAVAAHADAKKRSKCFPVSTTDGPITIPPPPPPPPTCSGKFESFTDCGTACPLTCDNVNNPPMFCTMQCVVGCFCDEGYVRNADGECVLPKQCPVIEPKCPKNEVYQACGTACPLTCKNYEFAPLSCSKQCVEGCFCKDGLVRNAAGKCIKPESCPPNKCPKNEKYSRCSGFCFEERCRDLIPPVAVCRPASCDPGCICEEGFYRSKDGSCMSAEKCGKELCPGKNQEVVSCTGPCDATCANPNLPQMCKAPCRPGCGCKEGFVRDENNECVALKSCPSQDKCGPLQEWRECGPTNMCDTQICRGRQAPCSEEDAKICVAGCFCKEGYKNFGGDCIKECPELP